MHTPNAPQATRRSDATTDYPDHRDDLAHDVFARQSTLSVLGHRHAWALDQPDFVDRQPDQPRLLGNGQVMP